MGEWQIVCFGVVVRLPTESATTRLKDVTRMRSKRFLVIDGVGNRLPRHHDLITNVWVLEFQILLVVFYRYQKARWLLQRLGCRA